MKKYFILFPLLVLIGVLVFLCRLNRSFDVRCISFDKTSELVFENVTRKDEQRWGAYEYAFYPKDPENFFEDYVKQNPAYVYSVDENNCRSKEETGTYIFCTNHRYYSVIDYNGELFTYRELQNIKPNIGHYINGGPGGYIITPLRNEDYIQYQDQEMDFRPWSDTFGLSSFEDLVEFYKRTGDNMFMVNEREKTILISIYDYKKWHPEAMQIKVREDNSGIEFKLLRYIKEEKIQYDER